MAPLDDPNISTDAATGPKASLERLKRAFGNLFSERQITLRQVDVTTLVLEGAASGMALAGIGAFLFRAFR